MSRSVKHAFHWHISTSGKNIIARSKGNRALRRSVKMTLAKEGEDTEVLPLLREVYNVYSYPSDGLGFFSPIIPKWLDKS